MLRLISLHEHVLGSKTVRPGIHVGFVQTVHTPSSQYSLSRHCALLEQVRHSTPGQPQLVHGGVSLPDQSAGWQRLFTLLHQSSPVQFHWHQQR